MAPIAGASPPDNCTERSVPVRSFGVSPLKPDEQQKKMSADEETPDSASLAPLLGSISAFVLGGTTGLSEPEFTANMSPLSATGGDYAPLNMFMESYKNRFQTQQQQQVSVVPHQQEATRTNSVSPKREREATTDMALSSSSQQEEDSSDSSTTKKVFKCPFPGCGKEFQLKGNLKRHENIHNGDKKFRCKFCGKDFLRKADMEVHHRVHTGEKPYQCKFADCDKSFARRSDLLSHERTHV